MRSKKIRSTDNEKEGDKMEKKDDLVNQNEIASISNLWKQYPPLAWSQAYNEYIDYTRRMTQIYNECAKSSQRMTQLYKELAANAEKMTELYRESANRTGKMTKYWLHFLWMKPQAKNVERNRKE
jgi:hypothetical protein